MKKNATRGNPPLPDKSNIPTNVRLYTREEVAAMLRCHPRTIMRLEQSGQLVPHATIGRRKLYLHDTLVQWIAKGGTENIDGDPKP